MAQVKSFLQKFSGQPEAQKEAEREIGILVDLANAKLDALESKLRDSYRNKEIHGKIEIVGDRLGQFARDYRVNFQDGDIGGGIQSIVSDIMNIGDEPAQQLIAKTINNALKSIFTSVSAGEEEKQLFKVVYERVAIVRYDFYIWRYTVRSDGLFKQTKSVIAFTYARGVVDHTKVSVAELNDAIAQSMPGATIEQIAEFKEKLRKIYDVQKSITPIDAAARFERDVARHRR